MLRSLVVAAIAVAALAGAAVAPAADVKQVPVVRVHASTIVAAAPAAVWAHVTTGKNLVTWCPQWKSARNATVNLTRVGDVLDYSDEWGNAGRSIVTFVAANKELRVAHEPNDGSYMCQARLVLAPVAGGTKVDFWDQYTDESPPTDRDATSKKMQAEADETLAALKRSVEKK